VPQIAQVITDTAGEAFVLDMTQAMFIGALITATAALLTFAILPTRIQRADEVLDDVTEAEAEEAPELTPPLPSPSVTSAD